MKDELRSWCLSRIYFRHIKGTPLEPLGWTGEKLARELEKHGYIKLIKAVEKIRYVEVPGKYFSKEIVMKITKVLSVALVLISLGCASPGRYQYEPSLEEYEASMPGYNTAPAHAAEADGKMNPYDLTSRTCTSTKIYNINGTFNRWDTICW